MLRLSLKIRSSEEALTALARIKEALTKSEISATSRTYLEQALYPTLELWATQLANPATKSFTGERLFSGDGYEIKVRARRGLSPISTVANWILSRG
jgi:hypothetical protein